MYDVPRGGEAVRIGEELDQVDVDDDLSCDYQAL